MKSLGFIFSYLASPRARRSARILGWMLLLLVVIVAVYSTIFHQIMEYEGQRHSWPTAVYWTLVTMSTLGYGDIAFHSDVGRIFSVVVLLSGSVFILVLLPFTFIQFVFVPWMESSQRARVPREVPRDMHRHVILTAVGVIEAALILRLERAGVGHVTLVPDVDEALKCHDDGLSVMVGELDDPRAYVAAGADRAAMVVATQSDTTNTNIAFTVREIAPRASVVATANAQASVDILELAGCDAVLQLGDMLGAALARRVLHDGRSHVIGELGGLLVAEALAPESLVGTPLRDSELRKRTGLTVGGVWERGRLSVARPTTVLDRWSTLVLAGSREQLDAYDELFGTQQSSAEPVIIIGGGRVGRAAGQNLEEAGLDYRIIEQREERIRDPERYVLGDAADIAVLERAGIARTQAVIVTTHDDDVNVYLTMYCRRLRPDVQLIARARLDRNVVTLHRAGADLVLSYASTGANALWNLVSDDDVLQVAEGVELFKVGLPRELAGLTLRQARIRESTGCTVVAVTQGAAVRANPDAGEPLSAGADLILIGDDESQRRFFERHRPR